MQHKIFIECVLIYSFNTPFRHILIESIIPNSFKYIFTLSKADLQPSPQLVLFFFGGGGVYEYLSCISCLYIYWNHHTMFTIFIDPSILPQKHKVDVTEHWNNPPTPRTLLCPSSSEIPGSTTDYCHISSVFFPLGRPLFLCVMIYQWLNISIFWLKKYFSKNSS